MHGDDDGDALFAEIRRRLTERAARIAELETKLKAGDELRVEDHRAHCKIEDDLIERLNKSRIQLLTITPSGGKVQLGSDDYADMLSANREAARRISELKASVWDQQEQYNLTKTLEEEDTRLRQRIAELEANLAAAHVQIARLEKGREVWRATACHRHNEIERLRSCICWMDVQSKDCPVHGEAK